MDRAARLGLPAILVAFLAIHAQILLHPAGYFAELDADEIVQVVFPRERIRAGDVEVLTDPSLGHNGGGILLAYLLAPLPLESPEAVTRAVRGLTILVAAVILGLWARLWIRHLGTATGLVSGVLLLFPNEGWITNILPAFGSHNVGALIAALAATLGLPWILGGLALRTGLVFGALSGYGAVALPGSIPTLAGVWILAVVTCLGGKGLPRSQGGPSRAASLALPLIAALAVALALLAADSLATGSDPLRILFELAWRPGEGLGLAQTFGRQFRSGLAGLLGPSRIWVMPAAYYYVLLGFAAAGLARAARRLTGPARALALLHGSAAGVTFLTLLLTRFAHGASYEVADVLPHLFALAAIGAAPLLRAGAIGRVALGALLVLWVANGGEAYRKRFVVESRDLSYPKLVVAASALPRIRALGLSRVAGNYDLAAPLSFREPAIEVCCLPRSSCPRGCGEHFFDDGAGAFLFPGPAGHLHGERETASLLARVVRVARKRGLSGTLHAFLTGGSTAEVAVGPDDTPAIPGDASAVLAVLPEGDSVLSELLPDLGGG